MSRILTTTNIAGISKFITGKVRDVYDLGDKLIVIATDRLSAFDVVLPTGIPNKGKVLTQLSLFWYQQAASVVENHLISADASVIVDAIRSAGGVVDDNLVADLDGRTMLVKKATAFPIECVARGYISGSLWKEYKAFPAHGGQVFIHGVGIPVGLRESDRLPEPIFTPATKAESGHDENVSFECASQVIGADQAEKLRELTLGIYGRAVEYALSRDLIIADTKFEFGVLDDKIILIDEALTPDSSRFWDFNDYKPGGPQASFDKQYVRDYLETLTWPKTYPGPELPAEVADRTAAKYADAYRRITGADLA
ncbi:MAG TPA: phosphoribosylaminoimidazolesuccinocarboxamide synthase [Capsulimonadaceae bacterium]|jgi:phosphoribosylaminoimidazole-succinocarboxamide synthase